MTLLKTFTHKNLYFHWAFSFCFQNTTRTWVTSYLIKGPKFWLVTNTHDHILKKKFLEILSPPTRSELLPKMLWWNLVVLIDRKLNVLHLRDNPCHKYHIPPPFPLLSSHFQDVTSFNKNIKKSPAHRYSDVDNVLLGGFKVQIMSQKYAACSTIDGKEISSVLKGFKAIEAKHLGSIYTIFLILLFNWSF